MAQLTPIRGFVNVPVSKSICILTTLSAILLSILQYQNHIKLILEPFIIVYHQYWRIITYQFFVVNESDFLLIVLLWFQFKTLERLFGSRKYLSLIALFGMYNCVACFFITSIGQLLLNFIFYGLKIAFTSQRDLVYGPTVFNTISPGPLGIISSLYIAYGTFIPISYTWSIIIKKSKDDDDRTSSTGLNRNKGVVNLTSHFFVHVVYTLLLLNNGFNSIIPCVIGLIIGKLHTYDLLPGAKSWLIPQFLFNLFVSPILSIKSLPSRIRRRVRGGYDPVNVDGRDNSIQEQERETLEEDVEEDLDRNNENQIRAETPVRPLGSQFLDTFRT